MRHLFAFVVFASMLPFGTARGQSMVQSQEGIALQNEILQLQQQVQNMQAGSGGGNGSALNTPPLAAPSGGGAAPDASVVTSLLTQVQQLQAQVQTLNGQVDTLQNQVSTQHDATEKEIGDLKFQVTNGAAPGAAAPGAPPNVLVPATGAAAPTLPPPANLSQGLGNSPAATAASPATSPAVPAASAAVALRNGQLALSKHDYATAESSARGVLRTSKSSPEGYQAQYLLAQSLYGQGKTQDAAIAYDDAYNRNRTGADAPAALLGLANSLTSIHQPAAACDTIASLNSQFPTPPAGLAPRIAAASHRAHCS